MYAVLLKNPGRIVGLFAACLVTFILLLFVLEQLGLGEMWISVFFIAVPLAAYGYSAWLARTKRVDAWYVADHEIPAVFSGMANASVWISGALLVAVTGNLYFGGYASLALIIGWIGGFVLTGSLIVPSLARSASYTIPAFLHQRYENSTAVSLCAMAVLVVASVLFLTAQFEVAGIIATRFFGVPRTYGMWAGLGAILLCTLPGGLRSVTWAQIAQYVVLATAMLVPLIWMASAQGYGTGEALRRIGELETGYGLSEAALPISGLSVLTTPQYKPSGSMETWRFVALALCMMAGTATLPHITMRFFATAPGRARRTVSWSLLFILIAVLLLPALIMLTKLQLLDPSLSTALVGKHIAEIMSMQWVQNWSATGMLAIADQNGDGLLQLNELFMRPAMVLLAAPEMAGLPHAISGLVMAGVLAAMIAGGSALMLVAANSLSHDFYHRIIDPKADMPARLAVARGLLVLLGVVAVFLASQSSVTILDLVVWAFNLACSALFFPLVLGIWWRRANQHGALAGMAGGAIAGGLYFYLQRFGGLDPVLGLDDLRFGIVGMLISLVAMVAVSLAKSAPSTPIEKQK